MNFTDIFSLKRPMSDETQQNSVVIDDIDYSDLDSARRAEEFATRNSARKI